MVNIVGHQVNGLSSVLFSYGHMGLVVVLVSLLRYPWSTLYGLNSLVLFHRVLKVIFWFIYFSVLLGGGVYISILVFWSNPCDKVRHDSLRLTLYCRGFVVCSRIPKFNINHYDPSVQTHFCPWPGPLTGLRSYGMYWSKDFLLIFGFYDVVVVYVVESFRVFESKTGLGQTFPHYKIYGKTSDGLLKNKTF